MSDQKPHGIMFHHFHGGRHPVGQGSISAQDFTSLIEFLGPERFLSAQDWMALSIEGTLEPGHLCLTFDDGLLCQYDIAKSVMARFGLNGFWFVYSSAIQGGMERLEIYRYFRNTCFDNIDRFYDLFFATVKKDCPEKYEDGLDEFDSDLYLIDHKFYTLNDKIFRYFRDIVLKESKYHKVMEKIIQSFDMKWTDLGKDLWLTADHLKELDSQGHCIGLHSFSHPTRMEDLSADGQMSEYSMNYDHLSGILGKPPSAMSHPCNSYSQETLAILHAMGIHLGFRANMNPDKPVSMLEWPREDHANVMAQILSRP
jgi:peptidoglycan/xylan/chitin deacetylase (PgdA/CDA1 family)